jgi:autophagy-related protein 9
MTSRIFGRLGPSAGPARSFYEELRTRDDDVDVADDGRPIHLDEENLRQHFTEYDAEGLTAGDSRLTVASGPLGGPDIPSAAARVRVGDKRDVSGWPHPDDDIDNDVPTSLLLEANEPGIENVLRAAREPDQSRHNPQGAARTRAMWEAAAAQQQLQTGNTSDLPPRTRPRPIAHGAQVSNAKEKALWRWVNTSNLDSFIRDVYDYYEGGGLWCILSSNALWLL